MFLGSKLPAIISYHFEISFAVTLLARHVSAHYIKMGVVPLPSVNVTVVNNHSMQTLCSTLLEFLSSEYFSNFELNAFGVA